MNAIKMPKTKEAMLAALSSEPVILSRVLFKCAESDMSVSLMHNGHLAITDGYLTDYVRFEDDGSWVRESDQLVMSDGMRDFLDVAAETNVASPKP